MHHQRVFGDLKLFFLVTIRERVALRNREEWWPTPDFGQPGLWPVV
jgi:hypothetical protein